MIKNIIFDMGNVLILWAPEYFVERTGVQDAADRELMLNALYRSPEWPMLDNGDVTEVQLEELARQRLPERLHGYIHELVYGWHEPVLPIKGMAEFIADCKKAGYGIYLLSNSSFLQKSYWPDIPGSELFDGRIVSAEVGCMKPDAGIYRTLLDSYGLKAEECLFLDDIAANIIGAQNVGMHGYLFDGDTESMRRIVRLMGVEV